MPLVIVVGMPCVGKSSRAKEIKEYFQVKCDKCVEIVSENEVIKSKGMNKNDVYADFQKEKEIRGIMKSNALRHLGRDNVVILDGGNYIKGYRYEMYCAAKSMKSTQVTVECVASKEQAVDWNSGREEWERYTEATLEALALRYEAPDSNNRWDSPLVSALEGRQLDLQAIEVALFSKRTPRPNASTVTAPVSGSDFLYELDKTTQDIVLCILDAKKLGTVGPNVNLVVHEGCKIENLPGKLTPPELARYRRQFLNYTKLHPPSSAEQTPRMLATLFVSFLNSIFSRDGINSGTT